MTTKLLVTLLFIGAAAFAQDSAQCYNPMAGNSFIQTYVCEFNPSGRVNVTETYNDNITSEWYTAAEWATKGPELHKLWDTYNASRVRAAAASIAESEKNMEAMKIDRKKKCVASGFVWRHRPGAIIGGECVVK